MREEAEAVADLAGELGLWTVFGSIHRLSGANRPHNSRYVVSDQGELVGRYDLYTPGVAPLVFEVDGFRFGCVLCATARPASSRPVAGGSDAVTATGDPASPSRNSIVPRRTPTSTWPSGSPGPGAAR